MHSETDNIFFLKFVIVIIKIIIIVLVKLMFSFVDNSVFLHYRLLILSNTAPPPPKNLTQIIFMVKYMIGLCIINN